MFNLVSTIYEQLKPSLDCLASLSFGFLNLKRSVRNPTKYVLGTPPKKICPLNQ